VWGFCIYIEEWRRCRRQGSQRGGSDRYA